MRHPEHERLIRTVPEWYHQTFQKMGYIAERRDFGYYTRNLISRHSANNRANILDLSPFQVRAFLDDLRHYYHHQPVQIWIEDRDTNRKLKNSLLKCGCVTGLASTYLAYVGSVPALIPIDGLIIEKATQDTMREYVKTRLMGDDNTEAEPFGELLEVEIILRLAEMEGEGCFNLAKIGNESVAVIGWYDIGADRLIFQVATRIPFRNRGIAKYLILDALFDAYQEGRHSVIINADPTDTPIQFYRRLGFTDEVFWRQAYQYQP